MQTLALKPHRYSRVDNPLIAIMDTHHRLMS
jgi:hypothetical protein